ncbi:hypothetical protein L490_5343 [Bordetella bronchiseptica 00-P-2796]|uniref:Uncharacterized protein n=1 Tax=Bordetella bronchiseptica 00-P-2796 TaxID=1331199 RepID=A0ABR4R9Y8_BORBO|nr:hypothetical protein L490_5343 [Bordetella bronchiseptica 00-P-2796]
MPLLWISVSSRPLKALHSSIYRRGKRHGKGRADAAEKSTADAGYAADGGSGYLFGSGWVLL